MVNYFELFDLPETFSLDLARLSSTYHDLQKATHPDRFAHQGEQAQRLALQKNAQLNDAFATLKSPLRRAEYLLMLSGIDLQSEQKTMRDMEFLMQQMEWRETLAELKQSGDLDSVEAFSDTIASEQHRHIAMLAEGLDRGAHRESPDAWADEVRKLAFLTKLTQEIAQVEAELDN